MSYKKVIPPCWFGKEALGNIVPLKYEKGMCLAPINADYRKCCEFTARDLIKADKREVVIDIMNAIEPSSNAQKAQIEGINTALGEK